MKNLILAAVLTLIAQNPAQAGILRVLTAPLRAMRYAIICAEIVCVKEDNIKALLYEEANYTGRIKK